MTTDTDDLPPLPAHVTKTWAPSQIEQMWKYAQVARAPMLEEIERLKRSGEMVAEALRDRQDTARIEYQRAEALEKEVDRLNKIYDSPAKHSIGTLWKERAEKVERECDELLEQIERKEQRAIAAEHLAESYRLQIRQQAEIIEKSYQAREKAERECDAALELLNANVSQLQVNEEMARRLLEQKQEIEQLLARLTCCCGTDMDQTGHDTHQPTSMYDHSMDLLMQDRDQLRARLEAIYEQPTIVSGRYDPDSGKSVDLIERPRRPDLLEGKLGFWPIERLK